MYCSRDSSISQLKLFVTKTLTVRHGKKNQQHAHFFSITYLIQLYSFRHAYEQLSVHRQEVCTSSFSVFYHASMSSLVTVSRCLIPQTPSDSD